MEKKCFNCKHMDICYAYIQLAKISNILNSIMRINDIGESGFTVIINTLAHDCTKFESYENN